MLRHDVLPVGALMSDQFEAAGALATAGLAAHALDQPGPGKGPHSATCANCGAPLSGPFCGQCGQRAHLHRHVGEVFHEFLHGITHLDGKAWKTLPMLLFRPGQLTRSYIEGQRARYIAPVPMFLMVVFLMFFALSFAHLPADEIRIGGEGTTASRAQDAKRALADLDRQIAEARTKGDKAEVARLETARATIKRLTSDPNVTLGEATQALSEEMQKTALDGKVEVNTGNATLDAKAREALKNPSLVIYKLQTKAYKLSFLLVPLSLPWLWLAFFWKRGIGMYDHAIFTLYSISFMSLLFIVGSLAFTAGVTAGGFWLVLSLLPAVHMFVQLRGAYGLGWWGAGWRTLHLSIAAVLTLSFYLLILVLAGLLD